MNFNRPENSPFKMPAMNNQENWPTNNTTASSSFMNKNIIIIILVVLLILVILGINILTVSGNILQSIANIFGPLITQILSIIGYTTGTVLNKSADIVGDTTKTGIDIAEGTVHSVADLLKNASNPNVNDASKRGLDNALNLASYSNSRGPEPDNSANPIQKPITSSKTNWCLVGEYEGKRGCIEVGESDKCISNQLFPSQQLCLNPTLSK